MWIINDNISNILNFFQKKMKNKNHLTCGDDATYNTDL